MTGPERLTDRRQLGHNRRRAAAMDTPATFLLEDSALELQERLNEVNKTFTSPAIVTGFPDFWSEFMPGATVVADTPTLDLTPGAHDLVIHALCLHWADDPIGQLIQCRRALKPDGLFLGTLFGGQTLSELRSCLAESEVALTGGLSPRVVPMAEIRDLGGLLQRAGFALPVADSLPRHVTYADAFALMRDLRAMGEGNALVSRRRVPSPKALFHHASALYAQKYSAGAGRITASFDVVTLTGWVPDESQQQPLRPGSATQRLAAHLNTTEIPLRD